LYKNKKDKLEKAIPVTNPLGIEVINEYSMGKVKKIQSNIIAVIFDLFI
jgi:hypothetical protein